MTRRKRRAQNKIEGPNQDSLIKVDAPALTDVPAEVQRSTPMAIIRAPLFSMEFEAAIEVIARERVYREMLTRLGRRLLMPPPHSSVDPPANLE